MCNIIRFDMKKNKEFKIKRLETKRLLIRPFYPMDLNDFHDYFSVQDLNNNSNKKETPLDKSETKKILMHFVNSNNIYAVVLKSNEKVIGSIEVFTSDDNTKLSIGYILSKDYWNNGFMTETIKKLSMYTFTKTNFLSIESTIFVDNQQSKRVMEKCGFKFDRNSEVKDALNNDRLEKVSIFVLKKPKYYKFHRFFKIKKYPWNVRV